MTRTCSAKKKQHGNPVNPEEHEREEGPERLQDQQRKRSEHFTGHMEQSDGQSNTLPHEEQQQQQDHLSDKHTHKIRRKNIHTNVLHTTGDQNNLNLNLHYNSKIYFKDKMRWK